MAADVIEEAYKLFPTVRGERIPIFGTPQYSRLKCLESLARQDEDKRIFASVLELEEVGMSIRKTGALWMGKKGFILTSRIKRLKKECGVK